MAITTYAELQTAIANFINDGDLTTRIPEFITLAESEIKADLSLIETSTRATASLSTSSRYLALPAYYIAGAGERMQLIDPTDTDLVYSITWTTPNAMQDAYTTASQRPEYVAIVDGQFEFNSIPDKAYTANYIYNRLEDLSGSNTTNEVFPTYLNCYLYGALKHGAIYNMENPIAYEAEYIKYIEKIKAKNRRKKYPSPLRARSRYAR